MDNTTLPYWLFPIKKDVKISEDASVENLFDFDLIEFVHTHEEIICDPATTDPSFYFGKFLID